MSRSFFQSRKRIFLMVLLAGFGTAGQHSWGQPQASSANDRAHFLAGVAVADTSPLKKLEQLPAYREHVGFLAKEWQERQKSRWDAMTSWTGTEIQPNINRSEPLFYLFGGPDFLNAHLLYPDAPRYVLSGLESVGRVPALETLPEAKVTEILNQLDQSLKPALSSGFFVTKEMGTRLSKSDAFGVLPLLYIMVVRAGNEIMGVQYLKLGESGELIPLPGEDPIKEGARGVKISFARKGKGGSARQELLYFRVDLSDKALQSDKRFLNYLSTLGPGNTYIKAASYLMHAKEFIMVRDFLLSVSRTILQDDSGIPYRAFNPQHWKITLYGNFLGPNSAIPWAVQPDLRKAYLEPGVAKPLPFKSSYGTREEANLLFAIATPAK
jgi:hypothetical protein